jgi:hypothetical protein
MREAVPKPHCPAAPNPGNGTAGQRTPNAKPGGTACGTAGGTVSLKALARLAIERDSARDKRRDSAQGSPVPLSRKTTDEKGASGTVAGRRKPWVCWL